MATRTPPLAAAKQADPAVVLLGQTNVGRDLAPALAFKLGTAVAMDTVALEMKDGKLHTTRPAYGGNARAINSFSASPAVATVRPKSQDAAAGGNAGAVEKVAVRRLWHPHEGARTQGRHVRGCAP